MSELKKKHFNKLKNDLEDWREIVLLLHDVLHWKIRYSCGIIAGGVSAFYFFLWMLDLSVVTQVAFLMLSVMLGSFFYPAIAKLIFKPEKWTGVQEKHLEIIITKMLDLSDTIVNYWNALIWTKHDKPLPHVIKASGALLALAWIGASVNNLLLFYLTTMVLCLWPGLSKQDEVQEKIKMIKGKLAFLNMHLKTK